MTRPGELDPFIPTSQPVSNLLPSLPHRHAISAPIAVAQNAGNTGFASRIQPLAIAFAFALHACNHRPAVQASGREDRSGSRLRFPISHGARAGQQHRGIARRSVLVHITCR